MDAPSRGSCTQKIPRTLANGELTMYSYAIEVSSVDRVRFLAKIPACPFKRAGIFG